jgi:hypothetical protein
MRKILTVVILLGLVAIALPMTAAALGLDVEAKAGAGIGLGSTDNKNITGSPRLAVNGGGNIDFYLASLGPGEIGLSVGGEYSHLMFHYTQSNIPLLPGIDLVSDVTYGYFNIPIALVYKLPVSDSIKVVVRAGGFIGFFLAGFNDGVLDPNIAPVGRTTLDSSNTIKMNYGLHFTAGADIGLGGGLALAPAIQFDWGLTDISVNSAQPVPSYDTIWSLTLVVGIKYSVL